MKALDLVYTFPIKNCRFRKSNTCKNTGQLCVISTSPLVPNNYSELCDLVAKLAYFNRRYVLFFRGQDKEYKFKSRFPTIYPNYFRKLLMKQNPADQLKKVLDENSNKLKRKIHVRKIRFHGSFYVVGNELLRFALLQHYEICDTPLIDLTQSLYVAASFALLPPVGEDERGYREGIVYVIALPRNNKIYRDDVSDNIFLTNLVGITPPQAKRPYRQEAYSVTSSNLNLELIGDISHFDLAGRVVCKFKVNNSDEFWNCGMNPMTREFLLPEDDKFFDFILDNEHLSMHRYPAGLNYC